MSRMRTRSPLRGGLLTIALASAAILGLGDRPASGSAIEYEFTGKVVFTEADSGIDLAAPIVGRLAYDSALGAGGLTLPGSPTIYDGPVSLSFTVGGKTFGFNAPAASFLSVQHGSATADGLGGGDQFLAGVFGPRTSNGLADFLALSLYTPAGDVFTDQSLPTTLDLNRFMTANVGGIIDGRTIAAQILTFQPVPEPSTLAVLAIGTLGGLAWARRRNRNARCAA